MPAKRKAAANDSSAHLGSSGSLRPSEEFKGYESATLTERRYSLDFRKDDEMRWQWSGATWTTEGCPQGERGGVHQFGVPSMTALRGSALLETEGIPQVVSGARDNNANFAWVQHFIYHLAPQSMAGFVLANGSMSSNQSGEGDIRQKLIEPDLADCIVALAAFKPSCQISVHPSLN